MTKDPVDLTDLDKKFEELMRSRDSINKGERKKHRSSVTGNYSFRFLEEYAQWRYEHGGFAILINSLLATLGIFSILFSAWLLAATSVGQALGLESLKNRATNTYYAMLWATRGAEGAEHNPVYPDRLSGSIEKVINDTLVVVYYEGGKQHRRLVKPANVITTDNQLFKNWVSKYHLKGIGIEFYQPIGKLSGHDIWGAVMWYRKKPINVELVELGIGYPEKNPPTAVVNKIFSLYYWHKAQSGKE